MKYICKGKIKGRKICEDCMHGIPHEQMGMCHESPDENKWTWHGAVYNCPKCKPYEEEIKKVEELVWILVDPDDESYTYDDAGEAIDRLKKDLSLEWEGSVSDVGFGRRELYIVEGRSGDVIEFKNDFDQLCNDIAEERADKEDDT